jgi:hypothetical protein
MDFTDLLLQTRNGLEFITILCQLERMRGGLECLLNTHGDLNRPGITLSLKEHVCDTSNGRNLWDNRVTHKFTLYHDGELTWEIIKGEIIVGLDNIKSKLEFLRSVIERPLISSGG